LQVNFLQIYLILNRSYEPTINQNLEWLETLPPLEEDNKQPIMSNNNA